MLDYSSIYPRQLWLIVPIIVPLFSTAIFGSAHAAEHKDNKFELTTRGTWALSPHPDPFIRKFPTVTYVPPGTVIFDSEEREVGLPENYSKVKLHYGHWVHIARTTIENGIRQDVLRSVKGLVDLPPSRTILVHESVFCPWQTNRIARSTRNCGGEGDPSYGSDIPVGKGWIYMFEKNEADPSWVTLIPRLDESTRSELLERRISDYSSSFEISINDMAALERNGHITNLNREHPRTEFQYLSAPLIIRCGETRVTEQALKKRARIGAEVNVEAGSTWSIMLAKLLGSLRLSASADVEGENTETTYAIGYNTNKSSYLSYAAKMHGFQSETSTNILVEKIFECVSDPVVGYGKRITKVTFTLSEAGGIDDRPVVFDDPSALLPVPDYVVNRKNRPVFISINSPAHYEMVLRKIMREENLDIDLAHFVLTNINDSCSGRDRRECAHRIDTSL